LAFPAAAIWRRLERVGLDAAASLTLLIRAGVIMATGEMDDREEAEKEDDEAAEVFEAVVEDHWEEYGDWIGVGV